MLGHAGTMGHRVDSDLYAFTIQVKKNEGGRVKMAVCEDTELASPHN